MVFEETQLETRGKQIVLQVTNLEVDGTVKIMYGFNIQKRIFVHFAFKNNRFWNKKIRDSIIYTLASAITPLESLHI